MEINLLYKSKLTSGKEDLKLDFDEEFLGIDSQKVDQLFFGFFLDRWSNKHMQSNSTTKS
jgi:hypothetical protein